MLFTQRHLVLGLAICAVLQWLSIRARRIVPTHPDVAVVAEGSFQPGGQYPGEPFLDAVSVRSWASWSGSDENLGALQIGPFPAPRVLRFGASGYPGNEGNSLRVELAGTSEFQDIKVSDIGERWRILDVDLPPAWAGRAIRITATDKSKIIGGWLGVSEPVRGGRSDGNNALLQTLTCWAINGLLLGILFSASFGLIVARSSLPTHWKPLAAGAIVAAVGYVVFWAYFVNALLGVVVSWLALAVALGALGRERWSRPSPMTARPGGPSGPTLPTEHLDPASGRETRTVLLLMVAIGFLHLALLHLFPTQHDFYTQAANRYREAMPSDNVLPHTTAERLFASETLRNPADEWLSSDRPPLQAGWMLITWPASKALGLDRRTASGTSAVWFQLLWVAAAYGLLRSLSVERVRAAGWTAAFGLAGFFLQNTVYTWPKLSAAAFACGVFALLLLRGPGPLGRTTALWSAAFASLAWLSHGGVAFSFLALIPFVARRILRGPWRDWLPAAALLVILVSPWLAYQKWYDPPANRLFKWHLGGQTERDPRGTWETIRDGYAKIGWREAWDNKVSNFQSQILGDWRELFEVTPQNAAERRRVEFFHTARALTWWPVVALGLIVTARRRWLAPGRDLALLAGWLAVTITLWCLLMFGQYQAVIHHGSYAVMIGLFVLCAVVIDRISPRWLGITFALQAVTLATTWALGNPSIHGAPQGLWLVIVGAVAVGTFVLRAMFSLSETGASVETSPRADITSAASPLNALGEWLRHPRLNFWVLAGLAILLVLRKPDALHTPQLWAEDGSIFLMQADLHGPAALTMPYMGYLHLLPRLIAQVAPLILDPAWWPGFYNGIAFVIWVAVLARLFSPRLALPGAPWLALAFFLGPNTGEVLFNITNLQWLTAFVLIQQALIAAPTTWGQRIGDAVIVFIIGLTGPFVIAFLPLFAWRLWRNRRADNVAVLAIATVCAAIQAWFVIKTGPRFEYQSAPFHLSDTLTVLSRRVLFWPVLGDHLALELPKKLIGAVGIVFLSALLLWALRPHPLRVVRSTLVAAFGLIVIASVFRTRPDTWAADNLVFGDRYFYIPRVLVLWLLVLEFNAAPRVVGNLARLLCLMVLIVHLRDYRLPAPPDLHWAEHCEPIRKGIPANIPTLPDPWTLEYRGRPGSAAK